MWIFKEEKKEDVLQGRTITYLAEKKLFITTAYLCVILNGSRGCSTRLAQSILNCAFDNAKIEDYFVKKGE